MSNRSLNRKVASAYQQEGVPMSSSSSSEKKTTSRTTVIYLYAFYVEANGEERRLWGSGNKKSLIKEYHLSDVYLEGGYDIYSKTVLQQRQRRMKQFVDPKNPGEDGTLLYSVLEPKEDKDGNPTGEERLIRYRMFHPRAEEVTDISKI